MLSKAEQQFIAHWEDQKSGPRWQYYLTFILAWSVVSFLVIFFLTKLFTQLWENGGPNLIYIIIGCSIIIGVLSTHFSYTGNEKKYKKLISKQYSSDN